MAAAIKNIPRSDESEDDESDEEKIKCDNEKCQVEFDSTAGKLLAMFILFHKLGYLRSRSFFHQYSFFDRSQYSYQEQRKEKNREITHMSKVLFCVLRQERF